MLNTLFITFLYKDKNIMNVFGQIFCPEKKFGAKVLNKNFWSLIVIKKLKIKIYLKVTPSNLIQLTINRWTIKEQNNNNHVINK